MLTKIEARNVQGSLLTLELADVSDGLVLRSIDGLDPVDATIVTSSFAEQNGTQYHNSRTEDRELVIRLKLEPDYSTTSVQDLRNRLYKFFMPTSLVYLRFFVDGLELDISGRVKFCKAPLFEKEPQMDITIICFDSDFVDMNSTVFSGNTTSGSTVSTLTYDGNVETGVTFTLSPNRTISEFTIYHTRPDGQLRSTDVAVPMVSGDTLTIVSIPGSKSAQLTHLGTVTSVLYGITPQSAWMQLLQGANGIRVYAEGAAIPYTITYKKRYGGL